MAETNDTAPAKPLQLSKDMAYNLQYQMCELQSLARAANYLLNEVPTLCEHDEAVDAKYLISVIIDRAQIVWDQFDNSRMYVVEVPQD